MVSAQRYYAGDPGSMPGEGGDDGPCLHKPWPHLTKGVKTGTSPMLDVLFFSRYAFNHLIESERDYVKDLNFTLQNYYKAFDGELPDDLKGQKEFIFATYSEIHKFHKEYVLSILEKMLIHETKWVRALMACSHFPRMGPGQVQRMGPGLMGSNIFWRRVYSSLRRERNQDPLFPVVLVQFPGPGPGPVQCG